MKRGPKKREHKKDFSALQPGNYRKFFSLVGLYGYGKSLRVWDMKSRVAAWKGIVKDIKIETLMDNQDLAMILDRTPAELCSLFTRTQFEPPFGFVLDVCFIFGIDPLRVYPELIWMRDIWMEDFKVHLAAAEQALDSGQMGVLREALDAMKKGAAAWENPELEAPMDKLLLVTKGEYNELYLEARKRQKARGQAIPYFPDEKAQQLINKLNTTIEARRSHYGQNLEEKTSAKKG